MAILVFSGCSKQHSQPNPPPTNPPPPVVISPCTARSVVNAQLVPIGQLSEARIGLSAGTAGSKILFAGGMTTYAYSSAVDIYDTITRTWSTAALTIPQRHGMAVVTLGNKIFFAGGEDADWGDLTSRVDIYDASTNTWTTAELSSARAFLAATTIGNKIFFAGGGAWDQVTFSGSRTVDVYDNSTNTWSVKYLSEGRYELTATTVGTKLYFAGGLTSIFGISKKIDIYDSQTNTWSTSQLNEAKAGHASIAWGNKIFWAGGAYSSYQSGYKLSNTVEIRDDFTGNSEITCFIERAWSKAVVKDDKIIFFTGIYGADSYSGTHFEIFNTSNQQWSTGVLNVRINDAAVIAVNNTIYVAGGRSSPWGPYFNQVWKLEF